MTRNSETSSELVAVSAGGSRRKLSPLQLRLRIAAAVLLLLNLAALYLYLRLPAAHAKIYSSKARRFTRKFWRRKLKPPKCVCCLECAGWQQRGRRLHHQIFPTETRRLCGRVRGNSRMAKASGIQERDAALSEEPIEGTAD